MDYHGWAGFFRKRWASYWIGVHPGVILASGDPVALDVQGVRLLQHYTAVDHLVADGWGLLQIKTAVKNELGIQNDDELLLVR
ncbi:MAG: hypothetical protein ACE5I8_12025 [Thermodesulfobacteriota bacterium]